MIGFIIALGFAGITLWNTYKLIQRIEDDEKQQMELWGLAQQKLASNKDLNNPIDPLLFQILTNENIIPMIVVDDQNNLLISNNIQQRKLTQYSLAHIQKLNEEFSSEPKPIEQTSRENMDIKNDKV